MSNDWLSSKDVQVYLQHSQISSFLVAINSTWSQGLFRTVRDAAAEPLSSTLGKQLFCLIYFALKCINLWKYWLVTISKRIKPGGYFLAKKFKVDQWKAVRKVYLGKNHPFIRVSSKTWKWFWMITSINQMPLGTNQLLPHWTQVVSLAVNIKSLIKMDTDDSLASDNH